MAQTWDIDQIIAASTSPATDIQRIIDGFNAVRSTWSGAVEPLVADQVAYMLWADTTTGLLKIRNAANSAWVTIGTMASTNLGLLALAGGNLTGGVNDTKTTVAAATTPTIFGTTIGNLIDYTGTTTCTGFAAAPQAGAMRTLLCASTPVFTMGANLLMNGVASGLNYTAIAGEQLDVIAVTTTQFRLVSRIGISGGPRMFISGLTYGNNATDAVNDIDIAAGTCRDNTDAHNLVVGALIKRLDAAWVVGTNQGGLDTGAIANADYYLWAIKRLDTGVTDILFSLSSTAPTMPANYTVKRLIGWIRRVAAAIVAFFTYETAGGGLEFLWSTPVFDITLANTLTTTERTDALSVPQTFSVEARIVAEVNDAAVAAIVHISCPDTVNGTTTNMIRMSVLNEIENQQIEVRTSATGTIAATSTVATTDVYNVWTQGFGWARRN